MLPITRKHRIRVPNALALAAVGMALWASPFADKAAENPMECLEASVSIQTMNRSSSTPCMDALKEVPLVTQVTESLDAQSEVLGKRLLLLAATTVINSR